MSSVTLGIAEGAITETTIQVTFSQWNNQMPGTTPFEYHLNVQPDGGHTTRYLQQIPHHPGVDEQRVTVENLQPDTQYRFQVIPIYIMAGTRHQGIPTRYSGYFSTLAGTYS